MFWSLSRLPSLDKLSLDVFYTNHDDNPHRLDANPDSINSTLDHYPPDIFLTILDCCRHLRELTVHGLFLEPVHETSLPTPRLRRKQSILRQWVRKTLRPRRENTPLTPDEAMTHSIDHASTWPMRSIRRKTLPLPQPLDSPDDLDVMNDLSTARTAAPTLSRSPHLQTDQYRIRTLELQSLHMDDEVFCTLTCRCPHLEELGLQGVWAGIREESWLALSRNCQRLRRLAIRHSDMVQHICSVPEMMSLFPRLESVRLVELEFDRDPDFSKVWGHWQDLEKGLNGPHPLKHLYLTGSIRWPLKVLLDVTTQSQGIESLSVGFTLSAVRPLNLGSRAPAYNLNSPWLCHETLTHLDLTCVAFAEQGDFSGFFGHVQRLPRLRSLWISISHVREARSIAAANYGQLPQLKGESRDDIGLDNFQSNLSGASGGGSVGPKEGSFVCFPALEMLRIGMAYYLDGKLEMPVELDEIVYMVTVSPALRRLELRHMSESGVIKELARIYPRIEFK
ncbi:hypothetical protein BGW38_000156 [Lunasporangiospora selenospora]|uniref:F-box domain-containing protein n=1 Tax=Lunasporangiospora selenospora TaxID=979761 RepID=A0A9P6KF61_9FUNG|nr:hypothetical protein BGW38_000156 [Lunasporangiospora selenospora]